MKDSQGSLGVEDGGGQGKAFEPGNGQSLASQHSDKHGGKRRRASAHEVDPENFKSSTSKFADSSLEQYKTAINSMYLMEDPNRKSDAVDADAQNMDSKQSRPKESQAQYLMAEDDQHVQSNAFKNIMSHT